LREVKGIIKLRWDERCDRDDFIAALTGLATAADAARDAAILVEASAPDFTRLIERARRVSQLAHGFETAAAVDRVRWIDIGPRDARLVESPLHIRDLFTEQRAAAPRAWIFTSATLGSDDDLTWFTESAALEDATKVRECAG
jgi:ATP-dependent DNA helicase DinG